MRTKSEIIKDVRQATRMADSCEDRKFPIDFATLEVLIDIRDVLAKPEKPGEEGKPCPHGRDPIGDEHGWKNCPHCLELNI